LELGVLLQSDLKNIDDLCLYDAVRYLFTTVGSPPSGCGPYTCAPKVRTVIYIRRKIQITEHTKYKAKRIKQYNINKKRIIKLKWIEA
jgi:hypothetical protein